MLAVAQDVRGEEAVTAVVAERGVSFPVLVDRSSELAGSLGFRIVPSGFFVDPDGTIAYRRVSDFDVADPRDRANLEAWLEGAAIETVETVEPMDARALEQFAEGVAAYSAGRHGEALALWRQALELDPDNYLIRSQIWAAEHPERFWPVVDREWQQQQLLKEGYDRPLP